MSNLKPNEDEFLLFLAKIKRKTLTGKPELVYIETMNTTPSKQMFNALEKYGVFVLSTEDHVVAVGLTRKIVEAYVCGFQDAHLLSTLSPVRTMELHTQN